MKNIRLVFTFILFCGLCAIHAYGNPVRVVAPAYPILVQANDQKTASELVFFCDTFISYMRNKWNITPVKLPTLTITASDQPDHNAETTSLTSDRSISINPTSDDSLRLLSLFLCNHILRSICDKQSGYKAEPIIPRVIPEGIVGAFLKIKINPNFTTIHHMLADGHAIPLEVMMNVERTLSPTMEQLFILQSTYFMEYLVNTNNGSKLLRQFLLQTQTNKQLALLYVARAHSKKNTSELAVDFYEKTILRRPVYNVVSPYKHFSDKSLSLLLDEILVFRYSYTLDDGRERSVTIKAGDMKVGDTYYITQKQIEEQIFQLRILKSCTDKKNHDKIKSYITALEYLKESDYNKYLDYYHIAKYMNDISQKDTPSTP